MRPLAAGIRGDRSYRTADGPDFTTLTDAWVNADIGSRGPLGQLYIMPTFARDSARARPGRIQR